MTNRTIDLNAIIESMEAERAKLDADLTALKRAREVAQRYGDQTAALLSPSAPATHVESSPAAPGVVDPAEWYLLLQGIMPAGHAVSVRKIVDEVREKLGKPDFPYTTVQSYLHKNADKEGSGLEWLGRSKGYKRTEVPTGK